MRSTLPTERDFIFNTSIDHVDIACQLVDAGFTTLHAYNTSNATQTILRRAKIGYLEEADYTTAYEAEPNASALCFPPRRYDTSHPRPVVIPDIPEHASKQTKLPNGVTVYGDPDTVAKLAQVVNEFDIWARPGRKPGLVNIPKERWMRLRLKPGVTLPRTQVYKLAPRAQNLLDTTFDKLHDEGKMSWATTGCHSLARLHCQGYTTPKTIRTAACTKRGEPHQAHTFTGGSAHRKAIVIACEMIETTVSTSVLAFITAIDFLTGEVLINSYVAPTAPVTNWLTPVTGITPEAMEAAIADGKAFLSNDAVRRALDKFLDKDTVVIGHAIQHDLRALNLLHGRIVDISVVTAEAVFSNFSSKTTLPRIWELKTLAKELRGIDIQPGLAHNPLEDAVATREVLIWCLRGPECLKAWAEKARSSYERVRLQRGENKKGTKNVEKKAGGETVPSAKAQGKKRFSK
ncbi:hypothetical protein N7534_006527 [Penicillium rubens]|nr:hypothetical protein N7534_006527 [Penicillium rubens]